MRIVDHASFSFICDVSLLEFVLFVYFANSSGNEWCMGSLLSVYIVRFFRGEPLYTLDTLSDSLFQPYKFFFCSF